MVCSTRFGQTTTLSGPGGHFMGPGIWSGDLHDRGSRITPDPLTETKSKNNFINRVQKEGESVETLWHELPLGLLPNQFFVVLSPLFKETQTWNLLELNSKREEGVVSHCNQFKEFVLQTSVFNRSLGHFTLLKQQSYNFSLCCCLDIKCHGCIIPWSRCHWRIIHPHW